MVQTGQTSLWEASGRQPARTCALPCVPVGMKLHVMMHSCNLTKSCSVHCNTVIFPITDPILCKSHSCECSPTTVCEPYAELCRNAILHQSCARKTPLEIRNSSINDGRALSQVSAPPSEAPPSKALPS